MNSRSTLRLRIGVGFAAGMIIALVDNLAYGGEVSPIVIVLMLLAASMVTGAVWGTRGWPAVGACWIPIPSAHLIKHVLGLPDTLHPNTYRSIVYLAIFSIAIAALGFGLGNLTLFFTASERKK